MRNRCAVKLDLEEQLKEMVRDPAHLEFWLLLADWDNSSEKLTLNQRIA